VGWSVLTYLAAIWRILVGMHSGGTWRLGRRPALDGVRGIAIGLVLLGHADVPFIAGNGDSAGVTLFFVLSGFLITALLLEERTATGKTNFRAFYVRRVRRLAPTFIVSVAVVGALGIVVASTEFVRTRDVLLSLSYVGNWYPALMSAPHSAPLGVLSGTWSLAVEEQFYLLWPLCLAVVAGRWGVRGVAWVAALGAVASIGARLFLLADGATFFRVYYGTDTNAVALLVGVLLAVALHGSRARDGSPLWTALGLVGLVTAGLWVGRWELLMLVAVAASACVVWSVSRSAVPGPNWLAWPALVWLGKRSYAVYLWNCMLAVIAWHGGTPWTIRLLVVTLPSLILAELSWRFVEAPFRSHAGGVVGGDLGPGQRGAVVGDLIESPIPREVVPGRSGV